MVKRNSSVEENSLTLSSPQWRSSVDEKYSSLDSRISNSFHKNSYLRDRSYQTKSMSKHRNSYQIEQKHIDRLPSFFRKYHQYSSMNMTHDINLFRLSQRSVSYGFGLEIKPWRSINDEKNQISSSSYQLPSNKIDLDIHQQEIIRRTLSLKRKSDKDSLQ